MTRNEDAIRMRFISIENINIRLCLKTTYHLVLESKIFDKKLGMFHSWTHVLNSNHQSHDCIKYRFKLKFFSIFLKLIIFKRTCGRKQENQVKEKLHTIESQLHIEFSQGSYFRRKSKIMRFIMWTIRWSKHKMMMLCVLKSAHRF